MTLYMLLVSTFLFCYASLSAGAAENNGKYVPATFRNLTLGRSKLSDLLRVLGKPLRVETSESEFVYVYEQPGVTFRVAVSRTERLVIAVEEYPRVFLSIEQAVQRFGNSLSRFRYSADNCLSDGESAPLYESPTGKHFYLEDRHRGLALHLVTRTGPINFIEYRRDPIGPKKSQCLSDAKND